jgi:hypothetical protein
MKVCWFSTGISSFVACYLAKDVDEIIYTHVPDQHPEDIAILDLDKVSNVIYLVEERRLEHGKVIAITDEELKKIVWDAIKNNKVKYHRGRKK